MNKIKLLIIEDEKCSRENLAKAMQKEGYEVFTAKNGKVGIDVFLAEKPDILITDYNMPYMNGLEVIYKIKCVSPHTPIILITASIDSSVISTYLEKVFYFLKKPVDLNQLIILLEYIKEGIPKCNNLETYIIPLKFKEYHCTVNFL